MMYHLFFCRYPAFLLMLYSLLAASTFILPGQARAGGTLQLQYLQDSSNTSDVFMDITTDVSKNASLLAGIGNTQSDINAGNLDLDYWNIGLGYRFSNAFDMEFETGSYGQGREINIDTIDLTLTLSSGDWSFSLKPQFDRVEVLVTNTNRVRDFDSEGLGLSISYYGIRQWELMLSYDRYQYSINPRSLALPFIVTRLSSKALLVTSGLKDNIIATDITYLLDYTDIGIHYSRSKSAIDQSTSDLVSLNLNFYHFSPYKLGLEFGAAGSDIDSANHYAGLTLGYLW